MSRLDDASTVKNVSVVGAGIAGSLLAYQLIRLGYSVTVYEPDKDKSSCSYAAAGMLAPMAELESAEDGVYQLGMKSLSLWPEIITELKQDFSQHVFFNNSGTLVVHHALDRGSFDQFLNNLKFKLGSNFCQSCESVSVKDYEFELVHFTHGLYLKNEAQVDSHQLLTALHYVIAQKGRWVRQFVSSIEPKKVIFNDGSGQSYDWVFDCRGLAAKDHVEGLHGVRGERILVHAPSVSIDRMIRLMHPRYRMYIVPRENNHYVIGATEIESSDDGPISVRSALELLSAAFSVHSGFAEARIIEMRTGVRPARLDHQPYVKTELGRTEVNGFYRHGYLIAPAVIADVISQLPSQADKNLQIKKRHHEYTV
jgi:glycine oxidase